MVARVATASLSRRDKEESVHCQSVGEDDRFWGSTGSNLYATMNIKIWATSIDTYNQISEYFLARTEQKEAFCTRRARH